MPKAAIKDGMFTKVFDFVLISSKVCDIIKMNIRKMCAAPPQHGN